MAEKQDTKNVGVYYPKYRLESHSQGWGSIKTGFAGECFNLKTMPVFYTRFFDRGILVDDVGYETGCPDVKPGTKQGMRIDDGYKYHVSQLVWYWWCFGVMSGGVEGDWIRGKLERVWLGRVTGPLIDGERRKMVDTDYSYILGLYFTVDKMPWGLKTDITHERFYTEILKNIYAVCTGTELPGQETIYNPDAVIDTIKRETDAGVNFFSIREFLEALDALMILVLKQFPDSYAAKKANRVYKDRARNLSYINALKSLSNTVFLVAGLNAIGFAIGEVAAGSGIADAVDEVVSSANENLAETFSPEKLVGDVVEDNIENILDPMSNDLKEGIRQLGDDIGLDLGAIEDRISRTNSILADSLTGAITGIIDDLLTGLARTIGIIEKQAEKPESAERGLLHEQIGLEGWSFAYGLWNLLFTRKSKT